MFRSAAIYNSIINVSYYHRGFICVCKQIICRRAGNSAHLQFDIPRGPLLKLLLVHIGEGHKIITQESGDQMVNLLISKRGKAFTNVTFVQYWAALMSEVDTMGQAYFPPSLARTMFIEQTTS